jgi:CheY-like chemotaxis protein
VALLTELADDMSLGIMSLRAQVERDHARLVAERRAEQLKALASELTLAEQRERQRLAQLLHDGLQQLLVGAKFRIGALERAKGREVQRLAGELSDLISESIESSRSLTYELCPPILRQSGLLSALEWLARWMEDKHGLTVHLKASCEVAPASEEATILLFQATRELLFNVVKHSGVKAARVEVACEAGEVRILVADRGTGFNPQQIRAASDGGLGLLSLRERLELLGGRVEIDSAPGRGSRFTLVAPLPSPLQPKKPARTDDQPVMAVGVPSRREVPAGGKKTRVMLADDHVVMRQGLAELLRAEPDLEVVGEASDGASAVELIREVRPTVVIMDINMPGMTGIEATKVIHRQWPDVRVIGLSMFDEAEQAAAMRMAGAAGYCSKSAAPTSLIATIRACLKSGKHRPTTAAKKKARRAKPARRGRPRRPQ